MADAAATSADVSLAETDPELRGAVLMATQLHARPGSPLEVEIGGSGVGLVNREAAGLSPGEKELVGLVAALLGNTWSETRLGLLTYSEQSMDPWIKAAAWEAVSVALAGKQVGDLRTLIVLIRTPRIEYPIHCKDEYGADYVAEGGRLVRRGPIEAVRQHALELARSSRQPTVVYLGAGFSMSSALPSGNDLRDRALREYFSAPEDAPVDPLARRLFQGAQEAEKLGEQEARDENAFVETLTLEDVIALVKELTTEPPPTLGFFAKRHGEVSPGAAVTNLAAAMSAITGLVIVTVNFDELLERVVPTEMLWVVVTPEQYRDFPDYLPRYLAGDETRVPLLKLHGTISDPESCVVSATTTRHGLADYKAEALRALARSVAGANSRPQWVYIGTSLRDKDIVPVLLDPLFSQAFEESWVMPVRPTGVDDFGNRREIQWRDGARQSSVDPRTYSASADSFTALLVEAAGDSA